MRYETIIVLDSVENTLLTQSLELAGFAEQAGSGDSAGVLLLLPGKNILHLCQKLSAEFGLGVMALEHAGLYYPSPDLLRNLLLDIIAECSPNMVCFQHSMRNCQTAAGLSAALATSSITAVESVAIEAEGPVFRRSIHNGRLVQTVRPVTAPAILTVLPGAFTLSERKQRGTGGRVLHVRPKSEFAAGYRPEGIYRETAGSVKLEEADIIVAAGRGIGREEQLAVIKQVAQIFSNAAVGASRPLCDRKWLPFAHQVGVTGKTVAPRLYLACGISGAQQHLAGMKGAQLIVAINKDPHAAIFSKADYIVVEDLQAFLPVFLEKYHERRSATVTGVEEGKHLWA